MQKMNVERFFLALFMLLFGSCIYILFRSSDLLMFSWFRKIHLYGPISAVRVQAEPLLNVLPRWFYYSLPNALWLASGVLFIAVMWEKDKYPFQRNLWIVLILSIGFGSELLQLSSIIPGTFDIKDLLLMILTLFFIYAFEVANSGYNKGAYS